MTSTSKVMIAAMVGWLLASAQRPAAGQDVPNVEGSWLGVLQVQGIKLRLAVHVTRSADGALSATLDSLDQGAKGLLIDVFEQKGREIRFSAKRLGLSYAGTIVQDNRSIRGDMTQGDSTFTLTFERVDAVLADRRPQNPVAPYPYRVEEVRYRNARDGTELAATLTVPEGQGPHPAVLLITGSGAQDRDETIAGHRPFLVLADYLTRQGIAVLRADDRGVGGSSPGSARDTTATYADDVLAGVAWLAARADIDGRRIGVVGHSEGANVGAIAAARSRAIAFVVMLAGIGQSGEQVILSQTALMQRTYGLPQDTVARTTATLRKLFTVLRAEREPAGAVAAMRRVLDSEGEALSNAQRPAFEQFRQTVLPQLRVWTTDWFRDFLDYDPAADLRRVRVPVLAVTGALDLQAPAKDNLPRIEASIRAGGNRQVLTRELPRLNHLLQTATTGLPNEYASIEETISPVALETIAAWVRQQATVPSVPRAPYLAEAAGGIGNTRSERVEPYRPRRTGRQRAASSI